MKNCAHSDRPSSMDWIIKARMRNKTETFLCLREFQQTFKRPKIWRSLLNIVARDCEVEKLLWEAEREERFRFQSLSFYLFLKTPLRKIYFSSDRVVHNYCCSHGTDHLAFLLRATSPCSVIERWRLFVQLLPKARFRGIKGCQQIFSIFWHCNLAICHSWVS